MEIKFVEFDQHCLKCSWKWLNDPEIKRLTNSPDFTQEQQQSWFDSLPFREQSYFIRGIYADDKCVGIVGLKNKTAIDGEYWGYIGEKEYWGKGIGKKMLCYIIDYAEHNELQRIYLNVIVENKRAIRLYQKMGFIIDNSVTEPGTDLVYMEYVFKKNNS